MRYTFQRSLNEWLSRMRSGLLSAPTLARQMWRHKYVIGRNEYLISTFSESAVP